MHFDACDPSSQSQYPLSNEVTDPSCYNNSITVLVRSRKIVIGCRILSPAGPGRISRSKRGFLDMKVPSSI